MIKRLLFFLLIHSFCITSSNARTFYLSATGDDTKSGSTIETAWRTIVKLNTMALSAGDWVLFESGSTFEGSLWIRSQGTPEQPIVLSSYGKGRATINSGKAYGFYAHNIAGIELRRLNFVGSGRLNNTSSGILFYLDSAATHLQHIVLDSIDVSGYQTSGISIGSWRGTSGYHNVRITNCYSHDNGESGIASYAQELNAHRDWYIGHCKAYNNAGRADITYTNTGNGIVMSGIDGVLIERCEAYNNGWLNANPSGGPVGIWGWCCNNLIIQECESHHNRSGTAHDGGGFDLDGGCTNSILQYNYSHDNEGPGYLLAQYYGAPPLHDVTIRYNISTNDAQRYNQGAIMIWSSGDNGGIQRASIHNNTVYVSPPDNGSKPKAVYVSSAGISGITFRNNVFQTESGLALLESATAFGVRFEGNCYWSSDYPFTIRWQNQHYSTLTDWRVKTEQEMIGTRICGLNVNPQLALGNITNSSTLSSIIPGTTPFRLSTTSALIGAGLNLIKEFGQQPGSRDFYNNATPTQDQRGNIGADENSAVVQSNQNRYTATSTWCTVYPTIAHDFVNVLITDSSPVTTIVQLYNMQGILCRTQVLSSTTSKAYSLSLNDLPAGRYILRATRGEQITAQSLIVTY
ncbi:T9SS type A sorting domain-containing protein [Hymenobacter profundi]|uniref:T9SS type A sorting domain-containing protein n=1 Tax=Hymenobacter profundi TaxID=1982110 RepID=A0ABS6X564_9BACT|nr:T9SS type A sorting domain-containing protein [Hymenobacter profundi]MBW3130970.1 T9SS type A sorting domain-containing protein [Hymenobacter profundi]